MFVYRSWPDLIRHRDIVYYVYGMCVCTEVSKTIDMYAFLFNDILLLTKIKKPPRKVRLFGCFFLIFIVLSTKWGKVRITEVIDYSNSKSRLSDLKFSKL